MIWCGYKIHAQCCVGCYCDLIGDEIVFVGHMLRWQSFCDCGFLLPQVSLLLGGIWFAHYKHEADCKNLHLLLLSQAMKLHVNTLSSIVCNRGIFELGPHNNVTGSRGS